MFARYRKILATTWHDSKKVNLVSSIYSNNKSQKEKEVIKIHQDLFQLKSPFVLKTTTTSWGEWINMTKYQDTIHTPTNHVNGIRHYFIF